MPELLDEVGAVVRELADSAGRSVVGVAGRGGLGSGVIVAADRVLTNAHNVRGGSCAVTFADGRVEEADVSAADVDGDLAVLAVPTGDAEPLPWSGGGVLVGQPVVALANPAGRGLRATLGFVSATARAFRGPRGRRIAGALEHSAPLPRGSSGGPVLDVRGALVGINTHRLDAGFYLALPADDDLRRRVGMLREGREPARPRLGVAVAPPSVTRHMRAAVGLDEVEGLLVREVDEDGPAAAAGIRRGDVLVQAGNRELVEAEQLFAVLDASEPGAVLTVRLVRGTEEIELTVTLSGAR